MTEPIVPPRLREMRPDPRGDRLKRQIEDCGGTEPETIEVVRIPTRVLSIEERFESYWDNEIKTRSLGWWTHFEGSREWIFVGTIKPDLNQNDTIFISIQKEPKP